MGWWGKIAPKTFFGNLLVFGVVIGIGYLGYLEAYRFYEYLFPEVRKVRLEKEESALRATRDAQRALRITELKASIPQSLAKVADGHTDPQTIAQLDEYVWELKSIAPPTKIDVLGLHRGTSEKDRQDFYGNAMAQADKNIENVLAAARIHDRRRFVEALSTATFDDSVGYIFISAQINRLRRDVTYSEAIDAYRQSLKDSLWELKAAVAQNQDTALLLIPKVRDRLHSYYDSTRNSIYAYPILIKEEEESSRTRSREFSTKISALYDPSKNIPKASIPTRISEAITWMERYVDQAIARERFEDVLGYLMKDLQSVTDAAMRPPSSLPRGTPDVVPVAPPPDGRRARQPWERQ